MFSAIAYIGPGPGIGFVGALFALLATIATAIAAILWWPIRRLFGSDEDSEQSDEESSGEGEDREDTDPRRETDGD